MEVLGDRAGRDAVDLRRPDTPIGTTEDIFNKIVTTTSPRSISTSWGYCESNVVQPISMPSTTPS